LRQETEQQLAKIQAAGEQEIASAAKAARHELKAYSAELALDLAEQKIRHRMTPEVDDSLIRSFVGELPREAN
jgi:F-type H+-transporting ATPase subunit b